MKFKILKNSNYFPIFLLKDNNIYYDNIGVTQKDYFELDKDLKISVKELYELNNRWYSRYNGLDS